MRSREVRLARRPHGEPVGEVIAGGEEGALVVHQLGWREHAIVDATRVQPATVPDGVPPSALLGALGMPGLTAWVGVTDIAPVAEGETVFIAAAAGAVGSVAGQIAKARGCRVIGSAGSPEKVAYVRDPPPARATSACWSASAAGCAASSSPTRRSAILTSASRWAR